MPIHDVECKFCGLIEEDVYVPLASVKDGFIKGRACTRCTMAECHTYYGNWTDIGVEDHGRSRDDRYDQHGKIKNFTATDDPLTKIELGIFNRATDKQLQTFSDDQVKSFRTRMAVDGDTPTLRKEILETRENNIKAKEQS